LFCDLVGSTVLGGRLDSEDISRLLRSYQAICRARIESHGGVIEKILSDADFWSGSAETVTRRTDDDARPLNPTDAG
jgi:class 3 adenylate cyclase